MKWTKKREERDEPYRPGTRLVRQATREDGIVLRYWSDSPRVWRMEVVIPDHGTEAMLDFGITEDGCRTHLEAFDLRAWSRKELDRANKWLDDLQEQMDDAHARREQIAALYRGASA